MKTCGAFRTEVDTSFDTHLRNVEIRLEAVLRAADDARVQVVRLKGLESRRSGPPLQAPWRTANREEKGTERPQQPAAATRAVRSPAGGARDGGGGVAGLYDAVRSRRAAAAAGDVSGLRSRRAHSRGNRGTAAASAVQRVADPEDGTMTLRFIVGRILRELIELAERDEDAELVLRRNSSQPAKSPDRDRDVSFTPRSMPPLNFIAGARRPATPHRARRTARRPAGGGAGRDCPLGKMMPERCWRVRGRGYGLFVTPAGERAAPSRRTER